MTWRSISARPFSKKTAGRSTPTDLQGAARSAISVFASRPHSLLNVENPASALPNVPLCSRRRSRQDGSQDGGASGPALHHPRFPQRGSHTQTSMHSGEMSDLQIHLLLQVCRFSGLKIYPGHGTRLTKVDCQSFLFLSHKCKKLFLARLKPAKLAWTAQYRKAHKKVRAGAVNGDGDTRKRGMGWRRRGRRLGLRRWRGRGQ